jgi:hypothetical protein
MGRARRVYLSSRRALLKPMNSLDDLFARYDQQRNDWQKSHHYRHERRNIALQEFDQTLSLLWGRTIKQPLSMSPIQRAFSAAKTQEEINTVNASAVANITSKYGRNNITNRNYRKAAANVAKYKTSAESRIKTSTPVTAPVVPPATPTNLPGQTNGPQVSATLSTLWNDLLNVVNPTTTTNTPKTNLNGSGAGAGASSDSGATSLGWPLVLAGIGLAYFIFRKK